MSKPILVIDDHEHLRFILRMTLELHGYEVTEADNGQAALDAIAAAPAPFGAIFCDIDMPVMHGVDFVKRFRAEYGDATPIVMLSAETSDLLASARAAGATDAIQKPFEPARLLELLNEILPA